MRATIRTCSGIRGRGRAATVVAAAAVLLVAWAVVAAARPPAAPLAKHLDPQATRGVRIDPPATPSLESAPREAPAPADGDASPRACAACQLADATTGQIPVEDLHIQTEALIDGVAVRATARDPEARELLWKAMVARGDLIEAMRTGARSDLCDACRLRSELLASLRIAVRRIPDGVELVYTSTSADIVREIHAAARATQPFVTRF